MNDVYASLLVAHVLLGLIGCTCSFVLTYLLIKENWERIVLTKVACTASLTYVLSWFFGGWYYAKYYGVNVKPSIIGGEYSWAHLIFMEAKEHVFIFLPFTSLALALIVYCASDVMRSDSTFKKHVLIFSLVNTLLAIVITLSGVLITGGTR